MIMSIILAGFVVYLTIRVESLNDTVKFQRQQIDWLIEQVQRLDEDIDALYEDDDPDPGQGDIEEGSSNVIAFRKASV